MLTQTQSTLTRRCPCGAVQASKVVADGGVEAEGRLGCGLGDAAEVSGAVDGEDVTGGLGTGVS